MICRELLIRPLHKILKSVRDHQFLRRFVIGGRITETAVILPVSSPHYCTFKIMDKIYDASFIVSSYLKGETFRHPALDLRSDILKINIHMFIFPALIVTNPAFL